MSGQLLSSSTAFSKEPKLILINACPNLLSFYMGQHFTSNMEPLVICIWGRRMQFLISVGCFLCPVRSWSILSSIILWVTWTCIMYLSTTSMDSAGPLMWKPANYNSRTPSQKLRPWQTDWCIIAGLLQGIWYGPTQTSPQEIRSLQNPWTTD